MNKYNIYRLTKRFVILIVIFPLLVASAITASAANTVDFELDDCSVEKNRLFTVTMRAKSSEKLSAVSFEITFDKNMLEFRSAKTADDNSKLTANELNNKVKAVYLYTNGKDISYNKEIFTLTFKAIKSGTANIDFYVSDCVNSSVKSIEIGECKSAEITVNSDGDNSNKEISNSKNDNSDTKSGKSSIQKKQETTAGSSIDELGELNSFDDKNIRFLIIGIAFGAVTIAGIIIVYNIIHRITQKKNAEKNSSDK